MYTTLSQQTFMPADWLLPCQKSQTVLKFELSAKNWNRHKVEFKNVVHHVCYGTSTLGMAHLHKEMHFLVPVKFSDTPL